MTVINVDDFEMIIKFSRIILRSHLQYCEI
jgi:hypothetical protein